MKIAVQTAQAIAILPRRSSPRFKRIATKTALEMVKVFRETLRELTVKIPGEIGLSDMVLPQFSRRDPCFSAGGNDPAIIGKHKNRSV